MRTDTLVPPTTTAERWSCKGRNAGEGRQGRRDPIIFCSAS